MIQSMTGFGKVTAELPTKKVTVEIKALNSKQLDLSTRIPSIYKDKEMQIRSRLLQTLERGKVDFAIYIVYRKGCFIADKSRGSNVLFCSVERIV